MERVERRNMAANALGESLWGFGASLAATLTVIPLLIERMGGGRTEVGLVGTVGSVGLLVPQALGSVLLGRGTGRKRFLLAYHVLLITPLWCGMGLVPLLAAEHSRAAGRALLFLLFGAFTVSIGFILSLWLDFVAGLFRPGTRGRAFGWSNFAAASGSVCGALVAGAVTRAVPYPRSYATLFPLGGVLYLASMVCFVLVKELDAAGPSTLSRTDVLARFGRSLAEPNFRRYLAARVLLTLGGGPVFFMAVHYRSRAGGGLAEGVVIGLGAVMALSQAVSGLLLGRLGDRAGHRIGALLGGTAQAGVIAVVLLAPGAASCAAAMALAGTMNAAGWVSHVNMLFETCPHDCRAAHITVSSLVLTPVTVLVPVTTGWLMGRHGAGPVLWGSLAVTALGLAWFLAAVKEPRAVLVREGLEGGGGRGSPGARPGSSGETSAPRATGDRPGP